MMLCIIIYYLNLAISDNKHELIQAAVAANITTHKTLKFDPLTLKFVRKL